MNINKKMKIRLFWSLLAFVLMLSGFSRYLEHRFSFKLSVSESPLAKKGNPTVMQYGSYGFYLASPPISLAEKSGRQKVIMLGNSVYLGLNIIERMQAFANKDELQVDFLNMAQMGTGIYDYLIQFAHVLSYKPDLVVVSFMGHSFDTVVNNKKLPKFRTDCDQIIFEPSVFRRLPISFYWREFNAEKYASAFASTLFPIKRLDWLLRREIDTVINRKGISLPKWFRIKFPIPSLNLAGDWIDNINRSPIVENNQSTHKHLSPQKIKHIFDEFLEMRNKIDVPILFLRHETGPKFSEPDVLPIMQKIECPQNNVFIADLEKYYSAQDMPDHVHPFSIEARDRYAKRHYKTVTGILRKLNKQRPYLKRTPLSINHKDREG